MADLHDNVRGFLDGMHLAVIGSTNADGSPHATALWYELRDDAIVMNTTVTSRKVRNLRRDPRASVCVTDLNPARHVTLIGTVTFDEDHVVQDLVSLATRYAGPEAGPTIAQNIAKVPHVTLKLHIDRVITFGKI
jgi:PPOX class probable F420-dependent enzyme